MSKVLTARSVEQAKPDPDRRREIPDGMLPGLYLVVQQSGAKSWAVRYRHAHTPRKLTLGPYPALDLADARGEARTALQAIAKGEDPAATRVAARRKAGDGRDLFRSVAADFIERHASNKRTRPEIERMLSKDVVPRWGGRRIQDLSRRDVIELLDVLLDEGKTIQANRIFSVVRKLFNWAVGRDIVAVSPCAGVRPPVAEVSRDRILSDDELRWLWTACDSLSYPFGPLIKLLLLTGQRLSEVAEMTAREVDLDKRLWVIPRERVKNDRQHDVPLSDAACEVLASLPRFAGKAGYLFTTTGARAVSGWSRAKKNLDAGMSKAAGGAEIPPWRLHDLRRTAASGMARLGINLPVIEKVLNHTSGSFAGIVGVYQRHSFSDEKRDALKAWGKFVTGIVEGEPTSSNVIPLHLTG